MLVSMECLIGSKYLKKAEKSGLTGETCLSMGRKDIDYQDPRIGLMAKNCQLWIDRNFALDYILKSIEKVETGGLSSEIRELRKVLKDAAYILLGILLAIVNADISLIENLHLGEGFKHLVTENVEEWKNSKDIGDQERVFQNIMDKLFQNLIDKFTSSLNQILEKLSKSDAENLETVFKQWKEKKEWRLINSI